MVEGRSVSGTASKPELEYASSDSVDAVEFCFGVGVNSNIIEEPRLGALGWRILFQCSVSNQGYSWRRLTHLRPI